MVVAVDQSLGVGENIEQREHKTISYSGAIRLKDIMDVLRRYEEQLESETAESLPDEIRPESDVITFSELASRYGVSDAIIEEITFPEHRRLGRTLVRPAVIEDIRNEIEDGMSLSEADQLLTSHGISEISSLLSALGFEVAWEGLTGGVLHKKE
jgi:hypothetical protein